MPLHEDVYFALTDELWEDMAPLQGTAIASIVVWDSSLVDESLDEPANDQNRMFIDFELYLANQTLLEIYGAVLFDDEQSDPLVGMNEIADRLGALAEEGAVLNTISSDEDDSLVLELVCPNGKPVLALAAAWLDSIWDTLPEDTI